MSETIVSGLAKSDWASDDELALALGRAFLQEMKRRPLATLEVVQQVGKGMAVVSMVDHALRAAVYEVKRPLRDDERIAPLSGLLQRHPARLKAEFYGHGVDGRILCGTDDIQHCYHWSCQGIHLTIGYSAYRLVRTSNDKKIEELIAELRREGYRPVILDELDALVRAHPQLVAELKVFDGRLVALGELVITNGERSDGLYAQTFAFSVGRGPDGKPFLGAVHAHLIRHGHTYVFIRMPELGPLPIPPR